MPANPFTPGDFADHKSGTLDPRPVAVVDGPFIRLLIGTVITPPLRAADYDRGIGTDRSRAAVEAALAEATA